MSGHDGFEDPRERIDTGPRHERTSGSDAEGVNTEAGSGQNPLAEITRVVGMLVNPLVEADRRLEKWYERNEPQIRRFAEVVAHALDGLPNWLYPCAVTFARGGWSAAPLGRMEMPEIAELVNRLHDEPDDVVRRELDRAIPEYFRRDGHTQLRRLVSGWDDEHLAVSTGQRTDRRHGSGCVVLEAAARCASR